ncbi:MAG: hypothetical protein H6662_06075 [Ardenticatenaceae bacterium]|nr:hypothetical protein [Ardenticatenaceae bacterium]
MFESGDPLSERELDVLACIVQGASNKEIASELSISQNTVKVHLRRIYAKLGVNSRTEATTLALQKGLVAVPGLESTAPENADLPLTAEAVPQIAETVADVPDETETAVPPEPTPSPDNAMLPAKHLPWRSISLGAAAVIAALLLLLAWQQWGRGSEATPTSTVEAVAFIERPLGDSRWLISRPMPTGRANMALAAVGLDLYVIGGESETGVVNTVSTYDTIEFQWTEGAPKPTAVSETSAAVLFGEIYVPGGRDAAGNPTDVVEVYSPANNLWRAIAPLPEAINGGLVLSHSGSLYFFGGWNGERYLDTVYEYNPALDSWQPLPPMSQVRAFAVGGAIAGQLYVVGGYDGTAALSSCEVFDVTDKSWLPCPDMIQPRTHAGAVVLFNKLYVFGGESGITYGEEYNPVTENWQVVDTPMAENGSGWEAPGVTNVETRIYAVGGRQGETLLSDTYILRAVYQTYLPALPNQ